MWLKLTYKDPLSILPPYPLAVNTLNVKKVTANRDGRGNEDGTTIVFIDGEGITVTESYTKVTAMLAGEIAGQGDKFKGAIRG